MRPDRRFRLPRATRAGATATRLLAAAIAAVFTSLVTACASTGATLHSGVGDTALRTPPWVAGASAPSVAADFARLGHLPIHYQRGATQPAMFDPANGPGTPIGDLLAEMNRHLDSLATARGISRRLVEGGQVSAVSHKATLSPPDVRFGCRTENGSPDGDCVVGEGALGRGNEKRMQLAVGRPSREWTAWAAEVMRDNASDALLVITLEIGQYLPTQSGLRGAKSVMLGVDHEVSLPWLTSLETPVQVLQLTGALVRPDGRAVRIAAEGIRVRRTGLLASALGAQELITDADVRAVREERRAELPGKPLVWQAALERLVGELSGR